MKETELQNLLRSAHHEIKHLREQNRLMSVRLEMFDSIQMMLKTNLNYPQSGMMHPDVAHELEKYADSLSED